MLEIFSLAALYITGFAATLVTNNDYGGKVLVE